MSSWTYVSLDTIVLILSFSKVWYNIKCTGDKSIADQNSNFQNITQIDGFAQKDVTPVR